VILVTGSTGNVGRELVRTLAAAGQEVRAVIRREADRVALPPGVEGFIGDLDRPETLSPALEGVRGVHLLAGYKDMLGVLALIREAGVEHVVLQSSSAAPSGDLTNAVARYHILSEQAVRESGIAWTFLQPDSFMSNASQWAPQLRAGDVVRAPFPDIRIAMIDPYDVAAVSARSMTTSGHEGRSYRLSGPESLLPADRVAVLARVLGRDLRFEGQSNEEARAEMTRATPPEYVDAFFRFFASGDIDESQVLPTVQEVTGTPPRTFEQWVRAHEEVFR
jgi:uncharacterized protein YbjT (DUF2867 family)